MVGKLNLRVGSLGLSTMPIGLRMYPSTCLHLSIFLTSVPQPRIHTGGHTQGEVRTEVGD